jgi:hypothetical protein
MRRCGLVLSILCLAVGGLALPNFAQTFNSVQPAAYNYPPEQQDLGDGVYDLTNVYAYAARACVQDGQAYTELNLTVTRLQREFKASAQYKAAVAAVEEAHQALDAARQPVLNQLEGDSFYQDLAKRRQTVALEMQTSVLPTRDLIDLATSKMQYGSEMHRIEAAALAKDSTVQEARQKLISAQQNLDDLREQFEMSLYKNPQFVSAKTAYNSAELTLAGAQGAAFGANITAGLASDADARRAMYNYVYGNSTYGNGFIDPSSYYGRRY